MWSALDLRMVYLDNLDDVSIKEIAIRNLTTVCSLGFQVGVTRGLHCKLWRRDSGVIVAQQL